MSVKKLTNASSTFVSTPHSEITEQGDASSTYRGFTPDYEQVENLSIYTEGDIKILKTIELNSNGMCCRFTDDGDYIAVALSNGDIKIFQATSGECIYYLADEDTKSHRLPATSLQFLSPEYSHRGLLLIATYASGMIKYWHVSTSTSLLTLHEHCQLLASSIETSSLSLITGGSSEEINFYDVETGKKTKMFASSPDRFVMDGHCSRILALKFHPTEQGVFLSGGWDDTVQIWDQREKHSIRPWKDGRGKVNHPGSIANPMKFYTAPSAFDEVTILALKQTKFCFMKSDDIFRSFFGPHICGDGIDVDEERNHILTSSWRKNEVLQVWDFNTGSKVKTFPADFTYESLLYCGQWLGQNRILCGGSDSNMVRIIDRTSLATSGMVCNLPSGVYSVDHDRQRLSHKHNVGGATLIAAVAGNHLYFISNAIQPKREEKSS